MTGLSKGVVGTVTKPVAGVLDFASGAASALRDTSKSHIHRRPLRARRPRCCYGHGGLLAPYSRQSAEAQEQLLQLNGHNYAERFVVLISSCGVMLGGGIGHGSYLSFISIVVQCAVSLHSLFHHHCRNHTTTTTTTPTATFSCCFTGRLFYRVGPIPSEENLWIIVYHCSHENYHLHRNGHFPGAPGLASSFQRSSPLVPEDVPWATSGTGFDRLHVFPVMHPQCQSTEGNSKL